MLATPATQTVTIRNDMKNWLFITLFVCAAQWLGAQSAVSWEQGSVSFVSSRNVYVKFASTEQIGIGDTLFVQEAESMQAALKVENKSSTSTVCVPLSSRVFQVGAIIYAAVKATVPKETQSQSAPADVKNESSADPVVPILVTPQEDSISPSLYKQRMNARISAASYSNFSDYRDLHRMRYAFNFSGEHVKGSRFSVDNYITYRHTLNEPESVQNQLAQALKVYTLSVRYDIDSSASLTLGRRINPKMSSVGAIDGLQAEKRFKHIYVGGIIGSRPDFSDYSLNLSLFQAGAFVGTSSKPGLNYHQSTLGIIEQFNQFKEDRRFVYFQHSSHPVKNLSVFGSLEVDLFENIHEVKKNTLRLTNLFVSMRYRFTKKMQATLAYDSRKNIIYYETYKNVIDQLIEDETRQGLRAGLSFSPFKTATMGFNLSWRFQQSQANPSTNYNGYLNFSKFGSLNLRTSITANILKTSYLGSRIWGVRCSHALFKNKADAEAYFRRVDYQFSSSELKTSQHIIGASISVAIGKPLSLFLFYEGTLSEPANTIHRINTRVMYRF